MKITSLPEIFRFTNRVQEKPDGQSAHDGSQQNDPERKKEEEAAEATPEELNAAIATFQADPQTREAGLTAEPVSGGPGLKVVLKDGTGSVVRQFTGEEFLKLREAASKDTRMRGKILDQKF
ncbi:MAG TPA: hypothetical protein VM598_00775 [Bdellovibrionota bacterium]|nr:hypothetical protein [Bdellovibrionota bacterium]